MSESLWNNADPIGNQWEAYDNYNSWGDWDKTPEEKSDGLEISEDTEKEQMNTATQAIESEDLKTLESLLNNKNLQPSVAKHIVESINFNTIIRFDYTTISPSTANIIVHKENKGTVTAKDEVERMKLLKSWEKLNHITLGIQ